MQFNTHKTISVLFTLLLGLAIPLVSIPAPADFKEILENSNIDVNKVMEQQEKEFIEKSRFYFEQMKQRLTQLEIEKIKQYTATPSVYDFSNSSADIDGMKLLNQGLDKIPPIVVEMVYSAQNIGIIIPKVGDYITANGRPWSFTESWATGGHFLTRRLAASRQESHIGRAVMYRVASPNRAKPIACISGLQCEAETLYAIGSAFKVIEVKTITIDSGKHAGKPFYDITLEEVETVPIDGTILFYKFTKRLTLKDIEQLPETLRVKNYDPTLSDGAGRELPPPYIDPDKKDKPEEGDKDTPDQEQDDPEEFDDTISDEIDA